MAGFKLICLPEGDIGKSDMVVTFHTHLERAAFIRGWLQGVMNYGTGGSYLIEWEKLGDAVAFEEEFGDDIRDPYPGTLVYTLEKLREVVGWKEEE